jgi:tRNA(His) 5'-end guanylyltransferase
MKVLHLYFISLLIGLFTSNYLMGQENIDRDLVKQLYEVLQNKNATSNEIATLTNSIDWDEIESVKNSNYNITLGGIIKNEWQSILFKNLNFQASEKNKVLVTGIVKGRKASECEYIYTRFKHSWSLKQGKIIGFLE